MCLYVCVLVRVKGMNKKKTRYRKAHKNNAHKKCGEKKKEAAAKDGVVTREVRGGYVSLWNTAVRASLLA